ncbi:hypothetical protein T3A99_21070 [Pseudomonas sp. N-137]|uniref:hypothetical protein n=1 Tax=Pseudomonas sp. N-137 TaxID=3108452 RepID=UPI002ADEB315|nr:hypothetical protein [Pseudomonas sp. N-137]MEA1031062.1 hypothetical protein [Pseudomonas sp. N-137]
MEDLKLLASLLTRINENQIALGAAVEELSKWVGERGSTDVSESVMGALATLDNNAGFINMALISLSAEGKRSS